MSVWKAHGTIEIDKNKVEITCNHSHRDAEAAHDCGDKWQDIIFTGRALDGRRAQPLKYSHVENLSGEQRWYSESFKRMMTKTEMEEEHREQEKIEFEKLQQKTAELENKALAILEEVEANKARMKEIEKKKAG